jgi:DNA polymerase-4
MLVDMNSFFASVEQQANPFLRGRPLGVSPSFHKNSCLIGTSKEAKAMGIKNGIPLYLARKICPKIIVIESEPEKYREVNRQINRIFSDYTEILEAYSVDESFLDLQNSKLSPLVIGSEIKKRIRHEVGEWLTCSVGIAPNKFMAKLAADLQKPDGLSVVFRQNLPEIYRSKKFTDLWGISRGWEKRFFRLGIQTPFEMLTYPVANLLAVFGKPGYSVWQRILGLEEDQIVSTESHPKSFGNSWVLNFRSQDKEKLKPVIMRLAEKAARRMRKEDYKSFRIYLSLRDVTGNYFHKSKKLKLPINTGQELYAEAMNLWQDWNFNNEIMHIAVGFSSLVVDCQQLDLFGEKTYALVPVLDQINNRYGEFTIRSGLLTKSHDFAPDSIAFGK